MGHVGIPEFLEQKWTRHAEGGARRTPNPVPQIAQKLSFGGSWDTVDRSGRRVPGSHLSWWRTDCVAGHVRFELRNVEANYPFESSRGFPGSERRRQEQGLDEALENTFPASDPVSVEQPTTSGRACRS